jgi:glycosyltransferase involved in cell wall biosynthesis
MNQKHCLFIPTFNVYPKVQSVFEQLSAGPLERFEQIVIVDNGSQDGTREFLLDYIPRGEKWRGRAEVWFNNKNHSLGGSVIIGIRRALQLGHDYLDIFHSDGQALPKDLFELVELCDERRPLVVGSRLTAGSRVADYGRLRRAGNQFFALWQKRILKREVMDLGALMCLPLAFIDAEKFDRLPHDMGYQPLLLMQILAQHPLLPVIEKSIFWGEAENSNVNPWAYGIRHFSRLLKMQLYGRRDGRNSPAPDLPSTMAWPTQVQKIA